MRTAPSGTQLELPSGLGLRPVATDDMPLLERIYASTRTAELAQTDWDDARKAAFLSFQFHAQHQHYGIHYADAERFVIEQDGKVVGRLYLHWRHDELRIVDITLLPEHRGAGIGGTLLRALCALAQSHTLNVSIHVEKMNPAMALYRRLGFIRVGEHGVYDLMRWSANAG